MYITSLVYAHLSCLHVSAGIKYIKFVFRTFDSVMERGPLLLFAPILGKLFPVLSGYTLVREAVDGFADYFRKPVNQHLKTFSPDFDRYKL